MKPDPNSWQQKLLNRFHLFEVIITLALSVLLALIIIISVVRIGVDFYVLFVEDLDNIKNIVYKDYQTLFGKILTLLITVEFLNSTIKVLKSKDIKTITLDIALIAALAISRKLIVFESTDMDPLKAITLGGLLLSIGVFYFFIRFNKDYASGVDKE